MADKLLIRYYFWVESNMKYLNVPRLSWTDLAICGILWSIWIRTHETNGVTQKWIRILFLKINYKIFLSSPVASCSKCCKVFSFSLLRLYLHRSNILFIYFYLVVINWNFFLLFSCLKTTKTAQKYIFQFFHKLFL